MRGQSDEPPPRPIRRPHPRRSDERPPVAGRYGGWHVHRRVVHGVRLPGDTAVRRPSNKLMPQNQPENIAGQRFGMLVVERMSHVDGGAYWHVRCDCGVEKVSAAGNIKKSQSCGCLCRRGFKHGDAKIGAVTPEYRVWVSLIARCTNPSDESYPYYGGRGIKVCDRWLESFENFLADMGRRPSNKMSIERTKNHLGYDPNNCVWATQRQQIRNRRSTVFVLFQGRSIPLYEAAEIAGFDPVLVGDRIRRGWPSHEAIATPKMEKWERRK